MPADTDGAMVEEAGGSCEARRGKLPLMPSELVSS